MSFIEYVREQQCAMRNPGYMNMLWESITTEDPVTVVTLEDEHLYKSHIPIDFTRFLKQCVTKLRDLKLELEQIDWRELDRRYLSTLIYHALEQESVTLDNSLYAANLFILINALCPDDTYFHTVTYIKVLETLKAYHGSQYLTNIIIFLMDDFKLFLGKMLLPEDAVIATISVLQDYTYCTNYAFEDISEDKSFENLGYMAFVNFKVLAQVLYNQRNGTEKLYAILIALASSLKSTDHNQLNRSVIVAHQENVRFFIKQNFKCFQFVSSDLVTRMLKFVCCSSEYDQYDATAKIIQQLPCDIHQEFFRFFEITLRCNSSFIRKSLLNFVIPVLHHPAKYETNAKRTVRAQIIASNVIFILGDSNEEVQHNALRILAELMDYNAGGCMFEKMLTTNNYDDDINIHTIQHVLHDMIDPSWSKKSVNLDYIHLMCNMFLINKNIITVKALNRLRDICFAASPHDLKSCIIHFKRLLETYFEDTCLVMYVLSIFIKQILDPMTTSALFAKELHQFIFGKMSVKKNNDFIHGILDRLISYNFDAYAVFEKFNSLGLLSEDAVATLIAVDIHVSNIAYQATSLKLLCMMLNFVHYENYHLLADTIHQIVTSDVLELDMEENDFCYLLHALNKILERKSPEDFMLPEILNFRAMHTAICRRFFQQMFPAVSVKYVVMLLDTYTRLLQDDQCWDAAACSEIETYFSDKLTQVLEKRLRSHVYLTRNVIYICELIMIRQLTLNEVNFNRLKKIVVNRNHTPEFSNYLKQHQDVWFLCILVYAKTCFVTGQSISECVESLETTLALPYLDKKMKLQLLYVLYDLCNMSLQYYDPLLPHLFSSLHSDDAYTRFVASKILMQLINQDHVRLIDGQFLLFISLLGDEKSVISKPVKVFVKESLIKKNCRAAAKYLIPSIFHYNFCYDHPTIMLLEFDRELLRKKKQYSKNCRCSIYYVLCQILPENVMFNILNQIGNEVLAKIQNHSLPHTSQVLNVLEDALTIIVFSMPKNQFDLVGKQNLDYFNAEVDYIDNEILTSSIKASGKTITADQATILKKLLISLYELLYSDIQDDSGKIYQNLVFVIVALTRTYHSSVRQIINEDSSQLKNLYKKLRKFVTSHEMHFMCSNVSINPCNLVLACENENTEFYLHEIDDYTMISPHVITTSI